MDDVVVDEWILIRALSLEEDPTQPAGNEERDFRPAEILAFVQESSRWVVTDDTVGIYLNRLYHTPYRGTLWRRIRASVYGVIGDLERRRWMIDPPVVEGDYHHKDEPWVNAASAAGGGCRLITGDNKLVADLKASGIAAEKVIVPMGLSDAHDWTQEPVAPH